MKKWIGLDEFIKRWPKLSDEEKESWIRGYLAGEIEFEQVNVKELLEQWEASLDPETKARLDREAESYIERQAEYRRRLEKWKEENPAEATKIEAEILSWIEECEKRDEAYCITNLYSKFPTPQEFNDNPERSWFIEEIYERKGYRSRS